MMDIGEIKAEVTINNGEMRLTLSEQERMKLIRRLAVSGEAYVDEEGNMDILFDLGPNIYDNSEEESIDCSEAPVENYLSGWKHDVEDMKEEPKKPLELFEGVVDTVEDEPLMEFNATEFDTDEEGKRSIDDLTEQDKKFIVTQYVKDVPTTAIMEGENITKSALYSALERERIPRKGKLNNIIRQLEDGVDSMEVSNDTEVDMDVILKIIDILSN